MWSKASRKKRVKREPTEADILMWDHLHELPEHLAIAKEYKFSDDRRWRFDFVVCDPSRKLQLGIEIEGGIWVKGGGGHNRGQAFIDDMEKYNHAVLAHWRVLRFTLDQVLKGDAIAFIRRVLDS